MTMLSTTSSPIVRSIGLICFLLLTVIYLLRIRNDDSEAVLDYTTLSESPLPTAAVQDADVYKRITMGVLSAGRPSIGDRGPQTSHSHEHGRTSLHLEGHEDHKLEIQWHTSKSGQGEQEETALKYHTKAFGTPLGSGGQLPLKKGEIAPGHKKGYGTPVETLSPIDVKPGQEKAYSE